MDSRGCVAHYITLSSTDQEILGPSDKRLGVIVAPPNWGCVNLGWDSPAVAQGSFPIRADHHVLAFFKDQFGDLVNRSWHAIGNAWDWSEYLGAVVSQVWQEGTSGAGAALTLTINGVAGQSTWVTEFGGGYNAAGMGTWTLKDGANAQESAGFNNAFQVQRAFPVGYPAGDNVSLVISLLAGQTSTGYIRGVQVAAQTLSVLEVMCPCGLEQGAINAALFPTPKF
jgi:hypothetical protein